MIGKVLFFQEARKIPLRRKAEHTNLKETRELVMQGFEQGTFHHRKQIKVPRQE